VQIRELELLAPAKNMDIGIAAVNCGADALYIAGPSYGAREAAGNPMQDIETLSNYAHRFGAKVYMVLNTILYDKEIEEAVTLSRQAYETGCDALIIQDLGLLQAGLPNIPLFASTQTNNRTVSHVKLLESLGFQRVILARELSLDQIMAIRESTAIELESFIHGALCVSYSGQCYLSASITGRSANRGSCAQPCRSHYNLIDGDDNIVVRNRPLLSLKDLNLSEHIQELALAGVTSFKIEGRLKNISYIKNVVRHYRLLLDSIINSGISGASGVEYKRSSIGKLSGGFTPRPELTFNRGYTDFNINSIRGKWQSGMSAKGMGEFIGTVEKPRMDKWGNLVFEYKSQTTLENGDGLCFVTPSGDVVGARASMVSINNVSTNEQTNVPVGSKIYRNYSHSFEKELEQNMPRRLLSVVVDFIYQNGVCHIEGECEDGTTCLVIPDVRLEVADKQEKARESIVNQLGKITDIYSFSVREIRAEVVPFFPVSILNSLRREMSGQLDAKRERKYKKYRDNTQRQIVDTSELVKGGIHVADNLDYRANISNSLAKELFRSLGVKNIDEAYEIARPSPVELMRCKYCIRHELDICLKDSGKDKVSEPLTLENNGKRYRLMFDCKNCEMVIFG